MLSLSNIFAIVVNLDNPNGVETTTYTRSLFKNSTLEYFKSDINTHNHNFKILL